jgi:hypothetical protein
VFTARYGIDPELKFRLKFLSKAYPWLRQLGFSVIAEAQVRSQVSVGCGRQRGTGAGLSPSIIPPLLHNRLHFNP